jgi:hypothetical protein
MRLEKRGAGLRQAVGMGAPTARSDDDKPQPRFSGVRSGFSERTGLAVPRVYE